MMKLRFEQVLEYLESAEKDPQFEQFLKDHPDGPRMLEEAKLLNELLQREAEDGSSDEDGAGEVDFSASEPVQDYAAQSLSEAEYDAGDDFMDDKFQKVTSKQVMMASNLARRAAGRVRNLGELVIRPEEGRFVLQFNSALAESGRRPDHGKFPPKGKGRFKDAPPTRGRMREPDAEFLKFMSGQTSTGELRLVGAGIEIILPGVMTEPGPIRLQVRDSRLGVPARGLELIYMPDDGPFTKISTNSKGFAELPLPEVPGVLRIESKSPQLFHIRLAKSF
jgi:hypothetical protein